MITEKEIEEGLKEALKKENDFEFGFRAGVRFTESRQNKAASNRNMVCRNYSAISISDWDCLVCGHPHGWHEEINNNSLNYKP